MPSPVRGQDGQDPYNRIVNTSPSPYWGYTYVPYVDNAWRAYGDFLIKKEEARLVREKVRVARLETRKLELKQFEWEREFLAGYDNRERKRFRDTQVEYYRNNPPVTEIIDGGPLNSLYDELVKRPDLSAGGSTPVRPDWLQHVHYSVIGRGNAGLLKSDRIFWPHLLRRADFATDRRKLEQALGSARQKVQMGQSDEEELAELRRLVDQCEERIVEANRKNTRDAGSWNPRHFIEAKQFLRTLEDTIVTLERPDAANYLKPLQGDTVVELVVYMRDRGLRFTHATSGDEAAYVALHRALANEVTRHKNQESSK
jgi:hypothetical protein